MIPMERNHDLELSTNSSLGFPTSIGLLSVNGKTAITNHLPFQIFAEALRKPWGFWSSRHWMPAELFVPVTISFYVDGPQGDILSC